CPSSSMLSKPTSLTNKLTHDEMKLQTETVIHISTTDGTSSSICVTAVPEVRIPQKRGRQKDCALDFFARHFFVGNQIE
ncbi:MAG: hypothetical protein WBH50_24630, partial [Fuerstiella sp.]